MNMQEKIYTEEKDDEFYDWIQELRISRDISYEFKVELERGFSESFEVDELGINCDKSITIKSKSIGITNPSHGNVPASSEVWAIKVGNGFLVTEPIEFSI